MRLFPWSNAKKSSSSNQSKWSSAVSVSVSVSVMICLLSKMLFLSVAFLCSGDLTFNMGFSHTLLLELLEFGSSVNHFKIVFFHTFEWKNHGLIGCDCQIQAGAFDLLFSPQTLCAVTVLSQLKEHLHDILT